MRTVEVMRGTEVVVKMDDVVIRELEQGTGAIEGLSRGFAQYHADITLSLQALKEFKTAMDRMHEIHRRRTLELMRVDARRAMENWWWDLRSMGATTTPSPPRNATPKQFYRWARKVIRQVHDNPRNVASSKLPIPRPWRRGMRV